MAEAQSVINRKKQFAKAGIPEDGSALVKNFILGMQNVMPREITESTGWRQLVKNSALTIEAHESANSATLLDWMWNTVLPSVQDLAETNGYGPKWQAMNTHRSKIAIAEAVKASGIRARAANSVVNQTQEVTPETALRPKIKIEDRPDPWLRISHPSTDAWARYMTAAAAAAADYAHDTELSAGMRRRSAQSENNSYRVTDAFVPWAVEISDKGNKAAQATLLAANARDAAAHAEKTAAEARQQARSEAGSAHAIHIAEQTQDAMTRPYRKAIFERDQTSAMNRAAATTNYVLLAIGEATDEYTTRFVPTRAARAVARSATTITRLVGAIDAARAGNNSANSELWMTLDPVAILRRLI